MISLLNFCSFPWWLAWLLPFLLGLLIGWALWSRFKSKYDELYKDYSNLASENSQLKERLKKCELNAANAESDIERIRRELRETEKELLTYRKKKDDGVSTDQYLQVKTELETWQTKYEEIDTHYIAAAAERDDWKIKYEKLVEKANDNSELEELKAKYKVESQKSARLHNELLDLKKRYSEVDKKISIAQEEATGWKIKYNALKTNLGNAEDNIPLGITSESSPKQTSIYANIKKENLQIVEGIGPKMESVLKENGIQTYSHLAKSSTEEIQTILDKYDDKYRIIDPTTWVQQAKLANENKWEELIALQKQLDTGKESALGETESKLEKLMINMGLIKKWDKDDLTAIEGIGDPAISKLMIDNGINTWRKLADTSTDRLKEILENAGSRFGLADPGTWPQQAELAAEGKFDELQKLQDLLDGGRTS